MYINFNNGYYDVKIGDQVLASFETYKDAEEYIALKNLASGKDAYHT